MTLLDASAFEVSDTLDAETRNRLKRWGVDQTRYESYPTSAHFHNDPLTGGVDARTAASWYADAPEPADLSLYIHVPVLGDATAARAYVDGLIAEIALVRTALEARCDGPRPVSRIHWGAGGAARLSPADILRLTGALAEAFAIQPGAEFAVEVEPHDLDTARLDALAAGGLTRASVTLKGAGGPDGHAADDTVRVAEAFRDRGVCSLNIDVAYGPGPGGAAGLRQALETCLLLRPDRFVVLTPYQSAQADAQTHLVLSRAAGEALSGAGYEPVGLDHFCLPFDVLARRAREGGLRHAFLGYTDDDAPALIPLGVSAKGRTPYGYVQNTDSLATWSEAIQRGALPISRGFALSQEDRMRGAAIERLLCDLTVDLAEIAGDFGMDRNLFTGGFARLDALRADGLVERDGWRIAVMPPGRPFLRAAAAALDAYTRPGL